MDSHDQRIRSVLGSAGRSIQRQVPSINWHVEGGPTRHYLLSLIMVIVDPQTPEDELAALAVTCSRGPVLRWTIDATGEEGTLIAEETGLTDADHVRMAADPDVAAVAVEAFVLRTEGLVVESLTKSIG